MSLKIKEVVIARIISSIVFMISIIWLAVSVLNMAYQIALNYIDSGKYQQAANILNVLPSYRDSESLGKYAQNQVKYKNDSSTFLKYYSGGYKVILEFDMEYQEQIDEWYQHIRDEQKEAHEREKYEKYGSLLPYDGMDVDDLKYTRLGKPDSVQIKKGLSTYATYKWFTDDKKLLAECTAVIDGARADDEVFGFEYYGE